MNGLSSKAEWSEELEKESAPKTLKRSVYLISPNKINQNFYSSLDKVLSFKNVKFFQLRLKNVSQKNLFIYVKR